MSCEKELVDVCSKRVLHEGAVTEPAVVPQDFSFCLPFGAQLSQKDGVVSYTEGITPPDGVYSTFTLKDGCIISVGNITVPSYTASPCAPIPNPCDCESGSGNISISTKAGNLSYLDTSGNLYTGITVEGNGVSVTGKGTANDPLVITASSSSAGNITIHAGNDAITVSGSGSTNDPVVVSHKVIGATQRIDGMSFDRFGHLVDYEVPSTSKGIRAIIGGDGIRASTDSNGAATIELAPAMNALEPVQLGGYSVAFDSHNIPVTVTREISLAAGTYTFGEYEVTLNAFGSVETIEKKTTTRSSTRTIEATAAAQETYPSVATALCKKIISSTDSYSITFISAVDAFLKIEIDSSTPINNVQVIVDSEDEIHGILCGDYRFVGLSSALYAIGQHTLFFNGTLAANTFITITLVIK